MRIDALDLIWIRMPLVGHFEISRGDLEVRNILLVRAHAGDAWGWGESGADWRPLYSYETVGTCWHVIEDFLAPELFGREWPEEGLGAAFYAHVEGWPWHPMARACVEEALWDLEARRRGEPVHRLYAEHVSGAAEPRQRIPVGISLGLQEDFEVLAGQIREALDAGYRRIKLKIAPGRDVEPVRRVRERFGDIPLMVDANCGYGRDDADRLEQLDDFGLLMIEQPLEHDDLEGHAELQRRLETPLCLDECIKTPEVAERALELGACRIVNVKCARLGGRTAGLLVHDLCAARGVPVWCGGMLEAGVGRLHNIAIASLPNFSMPGDLSASRRYWERDVIDPEVEVAADGTVAVPTAAGIGHEVREDLLEAHLVERTTLTPG